MYNAKCLPHLAKKIFSKSSIFHQCALKLDLSCRFIKVPSPALSYFGAAGWELSYLDHMHSQRYAAVGRRWIPGLDRLRIKSCLRHLATGMSSVCSQRLSFLVYKRGINIPALHKCCWTPHLRKCCLQGCSQVVRWVLLPAKATCLFLNLQQTPLVLFLNNWLYFKVPRLKKYV